MTTPPQGITQNAPTLPLSDVVRAAYEDLSGKIESEIEGTTDAAVLEALNPARTNIDDVLTKDNMYRLNADTALFQALNAQINDTNNNLKELQGQIQSIASHFALAGTILAAISKVLTLVP